MSHVNLVLASLLGIVVLMALYLFAWPRYRRRWLVRQPFPRHWLPMLQRQLPIYDKLSPDLQQQLQDLIKVFLHHKRFIGCAGLDITDEIKLTIAAQACLLLLNRPTYEYPHLRAIYVYPTAFRAVHEVRDEIGLVSTETRDLLGESWDDGKVILAWDEVQHSVRNFNDGYNVVLHEFAHQLDHESGAANGAPLLYTSAAYKSWAYVFGREFERLRDSDAEVENIIDDYGASDPAEFFAVATETFFEEPEKLFEHHRELYEELRNYYRLDPREWARND